jgi:hypothetical protein
MKLQSDDAFPKRERLVRTASAGRQPVRSHRQIKRVPMPVEHRQFAWGSREKQVRAASRSKRDGQPADFLLRVLINFGSENIVQQLRAETDAQNGFVGLQRRREEAFLFAQPRMKPILLHVHRSTHDDDPLNGFKRRQDFAAVQMSGGQPVSAGANPVADAGRAFKGSMLETVDIQWRSHV